jgi:hypothetical protein
VAAVFLLGALPAGCASRPRTPLMATVPREWRDQHPFGPAANEARARGELRDWCPDPEAAAWHEFARQNIQEGDLLFRYGVSYGVFDLLTTRIIAVASDGPFSHNAVAHWEGDCLWMYDAELEGVRKVPFERWLLDVKEGSLAVKRPKPQFQPAIPQALAYLEDAYYRNVPYDRALSLDDERLYCTELIEKAFRSAGLCLSDPVPLRCFPQYLRYAWLRPIGERLYRIRVDEPVFSPGNPLYGTYASPCLFTVYEGELVNPRHRERKPPRCPPVPFPAAGPACAPAPPPAVP